MVDTQTIDHSSLQSINEKGKKKHDYKQNKWKIHSALKF